MKQPDIIFLVISTPYKLRKKVPKVWYFSKNFLTFASSKVSINSINYLNLYDYGIRN